MNDPILEAAVQRNATAGEVQQMATQVFGWLTSRFKKGYVFTILAVPPAMQGDVVCVSTARQKDDLKPAAEWMYHHILKKVDRLSTVEATALGIGTARAEADIQQRIAEAALADVQQALKHKPDLVKVIRAALPLINPNGSTEGLNMLKAALLVHSGMTTYEPSPTEH